MPTFTASVQYQDWNGTAAADNADKASLLNYLEENGLITASEFLVGVSLWVGENQGGKLGSVFVHAFVYSKSSSGDGFDTVKGALAATKDPVPVRQIDIELTLEQFAVLFKRFAVTLTVKGLDLDGREYVP